MSASPYEPKKTKAVVPKHPAAGRKMTTPYGPGERPNFPPRLKVPKDVRSVKFGGFPN